MQNQVPQIIIGHLYESSSRRDWNDFENFLLVLGKTGLKV